MDEMFEDFDDAELAFTEDDESWDEDDGEDDESFAERVRRPQFRRGVPRIHGSLSSQRGVSTATLNTPAGNAQLKLPASVVTLDTFNKTVASLREAHNQLATQVNANRDAIKKGADQVVALERTVKKTLSRERRRARESSLMGSLMAVMAAQQVNARIDQIQGAPPNTSNPSMLMMMPMMSMMDSGGGKDGMGGGMGMMMMMMMMMTMQPAQAAH